ncbi:sterol desaturase family protein [Hephaestia sp. GCM10023244]|uniref:sterol desaturase family protein n=1 Tax=unclassified Hephaestia TaxID=2631281 RepID=UPI0020773DEB|nr:sterol desaturase family protein [Hephaestia sp. MAHUQ-44]MCM8731432.1 sterol desaturase family protein [Hephaestia sp. MAHUQ-44]
MEFFETAVTAFRNTLPMMVKFHLLLIPFILLEQIWPARERPRPRDYLLNAAIIFSTLALVIPIGMLSGMGGRYVQEALGLTPYALSFDLLRSVPVVGEALRVVVIGIAAFVLHDLWFYWSHRLEHKVPFLWEFHKLHHSEERMNAGTFGRDHFLQSAWRTIFPTFTLGLVLKLNVAAAANMGVIVVFAMVSVSMFYHSSVRFRLRWLHPVIMTPQVHRIHHSVDPAHHNKNFADFLPIFDIVFGTYHRPGKDEFPATGLGGDNPHRNIIAAQVKPVIGAVRTLIPKRSTATSD